jgi:uncharacterized membrane protein YccF (DUF307 family)
VINALMNVLWLVLGGFWMALGWWLAGVVLAVTIIGLPWARSCFVLGSYSLWPFGRMAVPRDQLTGRHDLGTGAAGVVGNVIWLILAGWWLALGHLAAAVANFVTIIGIPFGFQHLKLALIALAPVGQAVVDRDDPRLSRIPPAIARRRRA